MNPGMHLHSPSISSLLAGVQRHDACYRAVCQHIQELLELGRAYYSVPAVLSARETQKYICPTNCPSPPTDPPGQNSGQQPVYVLWLVSLGLQCYS
jgi:hypothetical protein